jgi:uncharacterized protein (DUF1015 family)
MATIKPFCAVRASRDKVALVSSRSYDAYSPAEIGAQLNFNPFSFLHIINPNFDRQGEISNEDRFQLIHEKYQEFKKKKYFSKDEKPTFYVYKKVMNNFSCCGIIGAASTGDYKNNIIKKHEDTLQSREILFEKYLSATGFNAEPVLLTFPDNEIISSILIKYQKCRAEYEFTTGNYKTHYLWCVDNTDDIENIQREFKKMNSIYIADGHHRTASSFLLSENLKHSNQNHTGEENYNYFMSYLIPESNLKIYEFNRLIKDLNGLDKGEFLNKLNLFFRIQNRDSALYKPSKKHHFTMYLDGEFYSLYLKKDRYEIENPLADLDTQILYDTILKPILGINDLRNDKRISYVHNENGPIYLKNSVDSGKFKVAFGLYPISIEQLKRVADANLKMPPKSTYILPKLRSGLTIYEF